MNRSASALIASFVISLAACANTPVADGSGGGGSAGNNGSGGIAQGGAPDCGAETTCGVTCANLQTDPSNCGMCGRSCIVNNAFAACVAGACALDECAPGFSDCDGDINNGCEEPIECIAGSPCDTACGSTGETDCSTPCAPSCSMPVEVCNAIDDDCNGQCDDGVSGCRVGIHRSVGDGHYYSSSETEIANGGFTVEVLNYFHLYNNAASELRPLFRCVKPGGKTFMSTATNCDIGVAPQATVGFIAPRALCGSVPLHRLLNPGNNASFYTLSAAERDNAVAMFGFVDEGILGYVWTAP